MRNFKFPPIFEHFEWKQHIIFGKNSPPLEHGLGKIVGQREEYTSVEASQATFFKKFKNS